jgi:hypothetical protein
MSNRRRITALPPSVSRIYIILIALFTACSTDDDAAKASLTQAKLIVNALNQYYLDENRYPNQLEQLVPKYMATLNPPTVGGNWKYQPDGSAKTFRLSFRPADRFPVYWYTSNLQQWEMDSG